MTQEFLKASAVLVALVLRGDGASAQRDAHAGAAKQPGFSYTMTATSESGAGVRMGITGGEGSRRYVAHAVVGPHRGRMDIVDGSVPDLFARGDYLLFDSTEIAIVHPATSTFALLTEQTTRATGAIDTSDVKMKVSDEKVRLDSIGPGDTISTYPTTHFRMTLGFNMDVEAMMARSRFGSEAVTDYWVASIPGMMSNPLLRSNGLAGSHGVPGMLRELSLRVDSASQRMGRTVVLRSSSVTRVVVGQGATIESHNAVQVSDLQRASVDEHSFIVPLSYKVVAIPGLPADSLGDGVKWKTPPPGR